METRGHSFSEKSDVWFYWPVADDLFLVIFIFIFIFECVQNDIFDIIEELSEEKSEEFEALFEEDDFEEFED